MSGKEIEFVSTRPNWTRIIKLEKDTDLGRQGELELEHSNKWRCIFHEVHLKFVQQRHHGKFTGTFKRIYKLHIACASNSASNP